MRFRVVYFAKEVGVFCGSAGGRRLPVDHACSAGDFRWEYSARAASFIELRDLRLRSG